MLYSYIIWTYYIAGINVIKFDNIKTETWSCILLYMCAYLKEHLRLCWFKAKEEFVECKTIL